VTLSLRARLFLGTALIVTLALGLATVLATREQRRWMIERDGRLLAAATERAARGIAARPPGAPADFPGLAASLAAVHGRRVTLVDSSGRVVGDSEVPREGLARLDNHRDRPEVAAALAGHTGASTRFSATLDVDLLYVAIPVRGVPGLAVVRLAEPLREAHEATAALARAVLLAAVLSFALILGVVAWVTGRHARRIHELAAVTRRLGGGEPGARARERPADEIGALGRSINAMAAELQTRLQALERERDERERILAHMTDGVALVDHASRIVHANRSLAAILGAALPPTPGTPFQAFARSAELDELLRTARDGGQTVEHDLRLWTPQQRLVRATATRLEGREPGAVLLVLHDLSEVERLDRVRRDFVANVSHELKTPLTSVRGYAETLLEGGLDDREHREGFVRVIRDQATRLQTLVEDLLSLAELERPDLRLRRERFDLREAAERQLAGFRDHATRGGLELALLPGGSAPVAADRDRIEQVIANLLDNALKYTEQGSVTVAVGAAGDVAWCEVRDTGPGIPAADLDRIFERFYRVDRARSREKGGTGLGLSIVKHIVVLHGGEVGVESTPAAGSVFRFEIPIGGGGSE